MNIEDTITDLIKEALAEAGIKYDGNVHLEHPDELSHGDFATNIAMALAKEQKTNSRELAEKIKGALPESESIDRVEVAGPGFINFFLSTNFFSESLNQILKEGEEFGVNENQKDQSIVVEYTNTNVLKPLHIGHLMGNCIGQALSNIFETSGADVSRVTYQGDAGLHIAKAVWGIKEMGGILDTGSLSEKSGYIGRAYALGSDKYENDEKAKQEIKDINKKLYNKSDTELDKLYEWGRQVSLEHFEELYKKLNTEFDARLFEREVFSDALKTCEEYKGDVFQESDGALVFKGEDYDPSLHTRVFVTSQGLPTYEAKDIAHAIRKDKMFPADKSIVITANEQREYFKVMLKALSLIEPMVANKTEHIDHGMLKLTSGKMASRLGNVITGEELLEEVEARVVEKMADRDMSDEQKRSVAEQVAVSAVKYTILKQSVGKDIIFDIDTSISFEGDSGPYLQYSTVRAGSVLEKADSEGVEAKVLDNAEISDLEKMLYRFPEVISRAGEEKTPSYLVTYLVELSSIFNNYYAHNPIVGNNKEVSSHRVALTKAFKTVMDRGLNVLGISVPEKM